MKAWITYNKEGQLTSVSIPNPEFGDHVLVEAPEDGSVETVDVGEVVKDAEQLTFAASETAAKRLREALHTIAEQHRVRRSPRRK
jgi:hypothetical protein